MVMLDTFRAGGANNSFRLLALGFPCAPTSIWAPIYMLEPKVEAKRGE